MSTQTDDIPQWKRELILRRKCHLAGTKSLANNTNSNNGTTTNNGIVVGSLGTNCCSSGGQGGDCVSVTPSCTSAVRQSNATSGSGGLCDRVRCDFVMVEERLCGATPADADSDSSEELQYGPGIVNKLKCKYLSLALRESRKSRPSVLPLRRATSLDDLLDDDNDVEDGRNSVVQSDVLQKNDVMKLRPNRAVSRGNESLKRARSVETLLHCDRNSKSATHNPITEVGSRESFNEDVVIDERPVPAPRNDNKNNIQQFVNKPRRPAPLLADTERPPPDTVRSALRIFESSVRRARPLKPVGEVALKVATYKHIIAAKKPIVLPKPITTNVTVDNIATIKPNTANTKQVPVKIQPTPVVYGFGSNLGLKPPTSPKNSKLIRTPPVVSLKKPVIINNKDSSQTKLAQDERITTNTRNMSPIIFRSPSPSSPILLSPCDSVPSPTVNSSTFPIVNGNSSIARQIGVIRPMEPAESEKQKAVELEKNLKNARESESNNQQQNQNNIVVSSWGPKRTWHQQTENTVVFNFRNRKDVPDYIENDGLVLKTRRDRPKINESGFILLSDLQSPNSTSDWDNEDDDEIDDVICGGEGGDISTHHHHHSGHHPPPPLKCDVVFEGAYVIINGKSSLAGNTGRLQPRAKLHIHFDDASTSTYEYPSEASLLEESTTVTSPVVANSPTLIGSATLASYTPSKAAFSPTFELGVSRTSPDGSPTTTTTPSSPLTAPTTPPLSPTTASNDVTDIASRNGGGEYLPTVGEGGGDPPAGGEGGEHDLEYLRPATDDQTVSWSQEKYATDLLF